jgi:hypothetical protein
MKVVLIIGVIAAVECTVLAADTPAEAQAQQADSLNREGKNHFRLNEFDAALKSYKEAYRLTSKPEFLYDIGQCYRKLDQKQGALDSFKSFLQESEDESQKIAVRDIVEKLEAAIRQEAAAKNAPPQGPIAPAQPTPRLGSLRITSVPDGATIRFDDDRTSRTGTTPAAFFDLAPGTRHVFITKHGYSTVERDVDITAGGNAVVDIQLMTSATPDVATTQTAAPVAERQQKRLYKKWWLWTAVGGVAAVGLAAGLGVGLAPGPNAPATPSGLMTIRY